MPNDAKSPRPLEGGVDPKNCADCPPDRICAWSCGQGWSVPDILVTEQLAREGKLKTPPTAPPGGKEPRREQGSQRELARQAMWECYN